MSRKYLSSEKALALFFELPSEDESIISDGSTSDEDYTRPLDLSSSDEDILEMEEELDDMTSSSISRPGPFQSTEVTWVPRDATKSVLPDFCDEAGPSEDILLLPEKNPISLFFFGIIYQDSCRRNSFPNKFVCNPRRQTIYSPSLR